MRLLSLTFFFFLILTKVFGQIFSSGAENPYAEWQIIENKDFRLIFTKTFQSQALQLSRVIPEMLEKVSYGFTKRSKAVLLIHNSKAYSNGMSLLAPKRTELFAFPEAEPYSQPWLQQLTLHELRHHAQLSEFNTGLPKFFRYLLGQQATGLFFGAFVPRWYFEGDAVWAETNFSNAGRGRKGLFLTPFFAAIRHNPEMSFDEATLGSYKSFIPDAYTVGYALVRKINNLRQKDLAPDILKHTARRAYTLTPFNASLKKTTGKTKLKIYKLLHDSVINNSEPYFAEYPKLLQPTTTYVSYQKASPIDSISLMTIKSDLAQLPRICLTNQSNNKDSVVVFLNGDNSYHCASGKIVWTEVVSHRFQEQCSFSDIFLLDLKTKLRRRITREGYFSSPCLSKDAALIAAAAYEPDGTNSLVVLNAANGDILKRIRNKEVYQYISPSFSPDNKRIVYVALYEEGKFIEIFDIENDSILKINESVLFHEIYNPAFSEDGRYLFFSASQKNLTEQIWCYDFKLKRIKQLTATRYGALHPVQWLNKLLFSEYTENGFKISFLNLDSILADGWEKVNDSSNLRKDRYDYETNKSDSFEVRSYSPVKQALNIHSYAPFYFPLDYKNISAGAVLMSQDVLGISEIFAGYERKQNPKSNRFFIDWDAKVFLPLHLRIRTEFIGYAETDNKKLISENRINPGLAFPLNFSSGIYQRRLEFGIYPSLLSYKYFNEDDSKVLFPFSFTIGYQLYRQKAHRSLDAEQAIELYAAHKITPFGYADAGSLTRAFASFSIPGIAPNHIFRTTFFGEYCRNKKLRFLNQTEFPRGYPDTLYISIVRNLTEYLFPIAYPDLSLGSVFYIKRVKATLFHDFAAINEKKNYCLRSSGIDLLSDFHLLRLIFPIEAGIRVMYLHNKEKYQSEFLFRVVFAL